MTKQEQIEKMAKVMCLFCKEMTEEKDCERGKECFDWRLKEARFYYEQGCRIINKDSVVLLMEEWECLHNDYAKALYNARQQARKETAKEILSYIGNFYDDCDQRFKLKDYQWHKRLCEKYGVEVEE